MKFSYSVFLVSANAGTLPVEIGTTSTSKPVTEKVTEVEVVATITEVSIDLDIVDSFYFFFIFFNLRFPPLKYGIISLGLVKEYLKLLNSFFPFYSLFNISNWF